MKLFEFLIVAITSLWANRLRSSLTMLGIIIGVGAVITLMSVGRGAEQVITDTFTQMGTNILNVQSQNPEAPGFAGMSPAFAPANLTMDDAKAMEGISGVTAVGAMNENFVTISAGNESVNTVIEGATPEFLGISNYTINSGFFISDRNVATRDMVAVLGSKAAEDLFNTEDPLGRAVNIKGKRFIVLGVLEEKGGSFFGFSMDNIIIVPITTFQTRLFSRRTATGEDAVQAISLQLSDDAYMDDVKEEITIILRKRHRIAPDKKDDFSIVSHQQALDIAQQVTGVFTIFLGAIAGISLVVGGIGIMNIMLVSVTERTREIGLRKAVGAKRKDILTQFLLEAIILSLIGGGIGILSGYGISRLISMINVSGQTLQAVVTSDIIILAISVSAFIGLVSGIYPAIRAARLDPIDALHYG
ncbi:MAG: ABC transporter permease [Chloroflexota bacterium]